MGTTLRSFISLYLRLRIVVLYEASKPCSDYMKEIPIFPKTVKRYNCADLDQNKELVFLLTSVLLYFVLCVGLWGKPITEKQNIQPISTSQLRHCCLYTPRLLRSSLLRVAKLVLRHDFLLDRLSAVLRSKRSYPAMLMAEQLVHQRFTIPGPLVQRNVSLNLNHPKKIGTVLPLGALNPTHVPL